MLADRVRMGSGKERLYLAVDSDFEYNRGSTTPTYVGTESRIELPHSINGVQLDNYNYMFDSRYGFHGNIEKVKSTNKNITEMRWMFQSTILTTEYLDLSELDTSNVTMMNSMFYETKGAILDISTFDISQVTTFASMFRNGVFNEIKLFSGKISSDVSFSSVFHGIQVPIIDLSGLDLSDSIRSRWSNAFNNTTASVVYTKTQADADLLDSIGTNPRNLVFIPKE